MYVNMLSQLTLTRACVLEFASVIRDDMLYFNTYKFPVVMIYLTQFVYVS